MSNEKRTTLSYEDAVAMLEPGDSVHTFMNPVGPMLIGAHWDRDAVLSTIRQHGAELAGELATSMHHGLVVWDGKRHVFFATSGGRR